MDHRPLSRLNAGALIPFSSINPVQDFFTKNLHYAVSFWQEHRENFREMIERLLAPEVLEKLAKNAAYLTITFNHTLGWISKEYNTEHITGAYGSLSKCSGYFLK